jgi:amidase
MRQAIWGLALAIAMGAAPRVSAAAYQVEEKSIAQLQADMASGRVNSQQLVQAYEARIAAMDRRGPALHAIIALNPQALDDARRLDRERKAGHVRGPLHGVPILLKDNIESADGTATTAGSLALKDNVTRRDAPLVKRLTDAGAVILGKANLSEWANIRSDASTSGWSAVGGLVRNPYALDRNACGSSSGSGAATASSFAAAAIGTETNGSITCPSAINGLAGIKPTVGLVSRTHVVPISSTQDTPGPMGRNVADVAAVLTAIAGSDPDDAMTAQADARRQDYAGALRPDALKGARLGVLRKDMGYNAELDAVFEAGLARLKAAGAEIVEIKDFKQAPEIGPDEGVILRTELKATLNAYLASTPPAVKTRTLSDLIAFDRAHAAEEMGLFGQEGFERADRTRGLDDPDYLKAKSRAQRLAGPEGLGKLMADNRLDAVIAPTVAPAWMTDTVLGDQVPGGTGGLAAIAGWPHLTVPMGQVRGLPVGISFMGPAWSEARLLGYGYAFEQATHGRRPPTYQPHVTAPRAALP